MFFPYLWLMVLQIVIEEATTDTYFIEFAFNEPRPCVTIQKVAQTTYLTAPYTVEHLFFVSHRVSHESLRHDYHSSETNSGGVSPLVMHYLSAHLKVLRPYKFFAPYRID